MDTARFILKINKTRNQIPFVNCAFSVSCLLFWVQTFFVLKSVDSITNILCTEQKVHVLPAEQFSLMDISEVGNSHKLQFCDHDPVLG